MSLREYLQLARRGRWWIAAGLLLGSAIGLAVTFLSTPSYTASTILYFAAIEGGGEPGQAYQGSQLAEQKARVYGQLLTSDRIANEVNAEIDGFDDGSVSPSAITVLARAGSPVIVVEASDASPERAARIADAVAKKGTDLVGELERPRDPVLSTVVTLRVVSPAPVPTSPTSPDPITNIAVGAALGVVLGFLVALVRRNLDRSVRTREALRGLTAVPMLGAIPYDKIVRSTPTLLTNRSRGRLAESIRQLRVNLRYATANQGYTSILVTSADAGEGKTFTAFNLAAAFGQDGDKVLLVDADLRQLPMGPYREVFAQFGVTDVVKGYCPLQDAVESWDDGLFDVLSSGPIPDNPSELLASKGAADLLAEAARRYDLVLVDAPALLPVADGIVLAGRCDATLLLVRHGRTCGSDVATAVEALRNASARLLGTVFTMVAGPTGELRSDAYSDSNHESMRPPDGIAFHLDNPLSGQDPLHRSQSPHSAVAAPPKNTNSARAGDV
jgi:succinoglycan biosynthesis transport protein ExoP